MYAALSGNIFAVGECLNNSFNPFLENSIGMTASDYSMYFNNTQYGQNLQSVIQTAIQQWREQVSEEQIEDMKTMPCQYFELDIEQI